MPGDSSLLTAFLGPLLQQQANRARTGNGGPVDGVMERLFPNSAPQPKPAGPDMTGSIFADTPIGRMLNGMFNQAKPDTAAAVTPTMAPIAPDQPVTPPPTGPEPMQLPGATMAQSPLAALFSQPAGAPVADSVHGNEVFSPLGGGASGGGLFSSLFGG